MAENVLAFAPDDEQAWQDLARGYRLAGLLVSAHRLGLVRCLKGHDVLTTEAIAAEVLADPRVIHHMCRALATAGVLVERDGAWSLAERATPLVADPAMALELDAMAEDYTRWGRLDQQARELAAGHRPPQPPSRDITTNVAAARRAAQRLSARHRTLHRSLIANLEPTRPVWVVDVGGGDGQVAREVCGQWPTARCTVLEVPAMAEIARRACDGNDRIEVVSGSFFPDGAHDPDDVLPSGADVFVLANVLDTMSRSAQRVLMARVASSLAPGGCVVSCETVLRADERGPVDVVLDALGEAALDHDSHLLTTTEQATLIRAGGLAATAEWWVGPHTRAVLGVRPEVGCEPALRVGTPSAA